MVRRFGCFTEGQKRAGHGLRKGSLKLWRVRTIPRSAHVTCSCVVVFISSPRGDELPPKLRTLALLQLMYVSCGSVAILRVDCVHDPNVDSKGHREDEPHPQVKVLQMRLPLDQGKPPCPCALVRWHHRPLQSLARKRLVLVARTGLVALSCKCLVLRASNRKWAVKRGRGLQRVGILSV